MDLSKAFDLINHNLLLDKLSRYGLRGKLHDWLKCYLSDRNQVVVVNGIKSSKQDISCGVPQGSVLGPLLFLLYVNDLPDNVSIKNNLIMFADDNSYLCCSSSLTDVITSTKSEITNFTDWFKNNKLFLNISKTVFINFTPRISRILECNLLRIEGKSIQQVDSTKFLGVSIDNALSWESHINNLSKQLTSVCYAIYRLRQITSTETILSYYYAHFLSRISYGIICWGSSSNSQRIFRIQKRAVRNITGASKYTSCREIFKKLKILPLFCIYILHILLYMRNNINQFLPNNFNHDYNTRSADDLLIPRHNLSKYEESPQYMGIMLYNKIPPRIKNLDKHTFSNIIKNVLMTKCYYSLQEYLEDDFETFV